MDNLFNFTSLFSAGRSSKFSYETLSYHLCKAALSLINNSKSLKNNIKKDEYVTNFRTDIQLTKTLSDTENTIKENNNLLNITNEQINEPTVSVSHSNEISNAQ